MNKRFFSSYLFFFLFFTTLTFQPNLHSYFSQEYPCRSCFCDPKLHLSIDWLYWRANRGDLDIAVTTSNLSAEDLQELNTISSQYETGVRGSLAFLFSDHFGLSGRYTHFAPVQARKFYPHKDETVRQTRLSDTNITEHLAEAKGEYRLKLQIADILLNYYQHYDCCRDLRLFWGARLLFLQEKLSTKYLFETDSESSLLEKNDVNGYGFVMGANFFQPLYAYFGLAIEGAVSALYSEYSLSNLQEDTKLIAQENCTFSSIDLSVALVYRGPRIFCMKPSIELGYEIQNWFTFRDFLHVEEFGEEFHLIRNKTIFGIDGMFLRVELQF